MGQAPTNLPSELREQIAAVEAGASEEERQRLRWTLTWLEGRPIVELDNGIRLEGTGAH